LAEPASSGPRPRLRLGYNSCGFARTDDIHRVVDEIADIGFQGMELTLDRRHLHSLHAEQAQLERLASQLRERGLGLVLNTGGRYALGPTSHEPGPASAGAAGRERFLQFVERSLALAPGLGAEVLMLHSGYAPAGVEPERAWSWLVQGCSRLARFAGELGLVLGFEFHPEMLVRDLQDWQRLDQAVDHPAFQLTLDVGHVACTEPGPIPEVIASCVHRVVNVHLEDIRGSAHVHLPIGQGDIDFSAVFQALAAGGYRGLINAELNSDDLPGDERSLARQTWNHLHQLR